MQCDIRCNRRCIKSCTRVVQDRTGAAMGVLYYNVVRLHEDCRGVLPISFNVSTCVKLCAYRNQFQCIRYSATELPIYTTCNVAQVVHTQQFCTLSRKLYFFNLHFFICTAHIVEWQQLAKTAW